MMKYVRVFGIITGAICFFIGVHAIVSGMHPLWAVPGFVCGVLCLCPPNPKQR